MNSANVMNGLLEIWDSKILKFLLCDVNFLVKFVKKKLYFREIGLEALSEQSQELFSLSEKVFTKKFTWDLLMIFMA